MARLGSANLNPSFDENTLINYTLNVYQADANTAGSVYVVAPHAGIIKEMHVVNFVANTTTKTVLTAKIGGVAITLPAWEIAAAQAVGTKSSSAPTAARTVDAGDVIEIISDGGGTPTMPVEFTVSIDRI